MSKQSSLADHGFDDGRPNAKEEDHPVQATCFSCGKTRWLKWIVDGKHVCTECKNYLLNLEP